VNLGFQEPEALVQLGILKEKAGDFTAAVKAFETLISLKPEMEWPISIWVWPWEKLDKSGKPSRS